MAILIVALAAMLAASLASQQNIWIRRLENQQDHADAKWLASAGTDFAAAILNDDARHSAVDYPGEAWTAPMPPMQVGKSEISGYILDQQGLFNLNDLAPSGATDPVQLANFRRLLAFLQLDPDLAQAAADWIDADNSAQNPGGAENSYYLGLPDPYRAANMPLVSLDDLLMVKGFDQPTIDRLKPYVTALPANTQINVNTAPPEVLAAILPGFSLSAARELASKRMYHPFQSLSDFTASIGNENIPVPANNIEFASQYFLVTVKSVQGRARVTMRTLLYRNGSMWPRKVWQQS